MMTVLCPNCNHRFPVPGCCGGTTAGGGSAPVNDSSVVTSTTSFNFGRVEPGKPMGHLFPGNSAASASNQQQVTISTQYGIQSGGYLIQSSNTEVQLTPELQVMVKASLTGGGCLVQERYEHDYQQDQGTNEQEPFRPLLISEEQLRRSFEQAAKYLQQQSRNQANSCCGSFTTGANTTYTTNTTTTTTPGTITNTSRDVNAARFDVPANKSPGTRRAESASSPVQSKRGKGCRCRCCYCCCQCHLSTGKNTDDRHVSSSSCNCSGATPNLQQQVRCCCRSNKSNETTCREETNKYRGDVHVHVNATVHLPLPSSDGCTFNITTTTTSSPPPPPAVSMSVACSVEQSVKARPRHNLCGGGIINLNDGDVINLFDLTNNSASPNSSVSSLDANFGLGEDHEQVGEEEEEEEEQPGTPVPWPRLCPWNVPIPEKEAMKLIEARFLVQSCSWYYEGLTWQQGEDLLRNGPVGKWIMRDSSDSQYSFSVTVQTPRGPTSVRVIYSKGKFRLDAEPRLVKAMPLFDCPIRMMEYYCGFSKCLNVAKDQVWVDFWGNIYAPIYLSEPLVKEVRPLSHLARIAVNRAGFEKERTHLPPLIQDYLAEYPYTL